DRISEPLARRRTRDRVEHDPECDPREQERRIAGAVLLLALHPVGGGPKLVEGLLQLVLDLLVGREPRRDPRHAAVADQLVVDVTRGLEGRLHVFAELLVADGALDVRLHVACRAGNPFFRWLRHEFRPSLAGPALTLAILADPFRPNALPGARVRARDGASAH